MSFQHSQHGRKSMNTSLASILNLRFQWEETVKRFRFHDDCRKHGTINNLEWFLEYGYSSNRLRKNYEKARDLAEEILDKA